MLDVVSDSKVFAQYAFAAYEPVGDSGAIEVLDSSLDIRGLFFDEPTRQVFAIRGVFGFLNGLEALRYFPRRDPVLGIKVHRGFQTAAQAFFKRIVALLKSHKPLYLVGHSMGGAVAVLLGLYLADEGYRISLVMTYGQPKVVAGSCEHVLTEYNLNIFRVVYREDPVPTLPPRTFLTFFCPYKHVGLGLCIDSTGRWFLSSNFNELRRNSFPGFWKRLWLRLTGKTTYALDFGDIQDHKMAVYKDILFNLKD